MNRRLVLIAVLVWLMTACAANDTTNPNPLGVSCLFRGRVFDLNEWVQTATDEELAREDKLLTGTSSLDDFFKNATGDEVREACDLFGGEVYQPG